jgi:hypothetical protein
MFKSTDYTPSSGGTSKILSPGTSYCKILNITLDAPPFDKEAYNVTLTLEGIDEGDDFTGIAIDKANPSLGNHRGKIAFVKNGRYPFSNYSYQGKAIKRDDQIFRFINGIAKQMNILDQMNKDNVESSTIEEYVEAVRKYLINPELWGFFTLAGQEYFTEGYDKPNYRLFFPKMEKNKYPYSAILDDNGKPTNFLENKITILTVLSVKI